MNVKQHIRMTPTEIALGRYMRAPEHPEADDFSSAFAQAALEDAAATAAEGESGGAAAASADDKSAEGGEGAGGADAGAAAGTDAGAATPAAGADAGATPPEPPAAAGAETPGATPPAADAGDKGAGGAGADAGAAAAATPPVDGEDVLKRLADEMAKRAPAAAPVEDKPAAAADAPVLFSDEEQGKLNKFEEDWPDVAEALTLRSRELGRGVVEYIFNQIAPEVKQIKDLVQTLALRAHVGDLGELIGDYSNEEVDQIKEWVKGEPTYLQGAYLSVIDQGTAEEVSDLVKRYREVTGKTPAATPAAPVATGGDTELSGTVKQAAESLAPVGSKRSVVPDTNDKSSFDAGWAQFATS